LHSLTAKLVFDALLKKFADTGIPEVISSDNASNFTSKLTQEFLRVFGCNPRFATPAHPQACGLVKRLVGSIKPAISKIAADHPKQWHTHLACVLWALRDAPNSTTNAPLWQLTFGRLPRGTMSVFRDSWVGTEDPPLSLGKTVTEYLRDLRDRFATAEHYASTHADTQQAQYAARYNLRSCEKQCDVGEQLLVLTPDSTANKVFSRCRGPGVIVFKNSPHSFIVELDDSRIHVHVNKLRKFHQRVHEVSCDIPVYLAVNCNSAFIYERHVDFGEVVVPETTYPTPDHKRPSEKIIESKLSHVQLWQR